MTNQHFKQARWTQSCGISPKLANRLALMLVALFISVLAVAAPAEPKLKKAQSTTAPAAPATIPQVVIVGKRMTDEQKRQWDAKSALQIAGTRPDTLHKK